MTCYLNHLGIVNALGADHASIIDNMVAGRRPGIQSSDWIPDFPTYIASIPGEPAELPTELKSEYQSRNNQLAWQALQQLSTQIDELKTRFEPTRIAVIIGTSTSGIGEGEQALIEQAATGNRPANYRYQQQEIGTVAEFIAEACGFYGPAYTISTACSSSGHAFNSAQAMLENNQVDAVIAGGVDSLCRLTVNGFAALESVSPNKANPSSVNRSGINIGEAAALFVVTREPSARAVELISVGSSSDAHHISAPHPEGDGAERAIRDALNRGIVNEDEITYINLHGTGTVLNDAMESKVVMRMFGAEVPCASSKGQLGHSLGAAAANELGLCWLSLQKENSQRCVPPHLWDGQRDDKLEPILLAEPGTQYDSARPQTILSSSFAFGGNNTAVIIREIARAD